MKHIVTRQLMNIYQMKQVFTVAQELEYVREGVSTDYRDLMMSNGFNQNYELSITGGTEKTQHSISLGYRGENGLFKMIIINA